MDDVTVSTTKKGTKMATEKVDVQKLLAEIEKFSPRDFAVFAVKANEIQTKKKKEQLKEIADLYVESLESAGFSKEEGIAALGATPAKGASRRAEKATPSIDIGKEFWGKTFKDPATGETWTKSATGKGKPKQWLVDAINGGKTLEELLVK